MQKVLVIVGPTASGKSALSVQLAHMFNGEIISADSRQVYRGLDIGTGKITRGEMRGVPHHLIDVTSPKRAFTAHDYVLVARRAINEIAKRGKLPIIVGGTGFYIDTLLGRIVLPNVTANPKLRTRFEKKSTVQLFEILRKRDPRRAKTIDPHNKRRLVRALEIVYTLGFVSMSDLQGRSYEALWIGIAPTKIQREKNIRSRLNKRIRGMITEARRLHRDGLSYRRMEELGLEYRYLARLLQKKITRQEFEDQLGREISRYAKRQVTYWKRNNQIHWLKPDDKKVAVALIKTWKKKQRGRH